MEKVKQKGEVHQQRKISQLCRLTRTMEEIMQPLKQQTFLHRRTPWAYVLLLFLTTQKHHHSIGSQGQDAQQSSLFPVAY